MLYTKIQTNLERKLIVSISLLIFTALFPHKSPGKYPHFHHTRPTTIHRPAVDKPTKYHQVATATHQLNLVCTHTMPYIALSDSSLAFHYPLRKYYPNYYIPMKIHLENNFVYLI